MKLRNAGKRIMVTFKSTYFKDITLKLFGSQCMLRGVVKQCCLPDMDLIYMVTYACLSSVQTTQRIGPSWNNPTNTMPFIAWKDTAHRQIYTMPCMVDWAPTHTWRHCMPLNTITQHVQCLPPVVLGASYASSPLLSVLLFVVPSSGILGHLPAF